MNIFYLDEDPKLCAQYHCDKHVCKMIIEGVQLLSTAHWMTGGEAPYKKTHVNHPSNKWVRESLSNYVWLCDMTMELCKEYTHRYGKRHKTQQHLEWCMVNLPNIEDKGFTEIPQAMPDECKRENPIDGYRNYYNVEKAYMCKWKNREIPEWFNPIQLSLV
jgi:hypothetical protein